MLLDDFRATQSPVVMGPGVRRDDDVGTHLRLPAARNARVMHDPVPSENRGRRESRVPVAPAASCAKCRKHTSVVTTSSPEHPAFPHAMVLTAYFALSPVTGLCCHRRLADTTATLGASVGASGPHDFAVRKVAISS